MMISNKPPRKTTFLLKRSESTPPQSQPTNLHNKSPSLEFPTSQLIVGEERLHFGHPQHPLSQVILPDLFTCAGCKEYGAGKRFICQLCDFQLHDFCALAPPALMNHPFHIQHQLVFYSKAGNSFITYDTLTINCHAYTQIYIYIYQNSLETNPNQWLLVRYTDAKSVILPNYIFCLAIYRRL